MSIKLTKLIYKEADAWMRRHKYEHLEYINNGDCYLFASHIIELAPGFQAKGLTIIMGNGHYWLRYKGRHYDAECAAGAKHPRDIPFYKRCESMLDSWTKAKEPYDTFR